MKDALKECKALLAELNNQLARKESFERLLDIYAQFCPKSYTIYNRHFKFTKHDLLQHKRLRQLLHSDGQIRIWSATRRKLFQMLCLILNDIVVFLRIESSSSSSSSSSPLVATTTSAAAAAASASTATTTVTSPSISSIGLAQTQTSGRNNFLFHAPHHHLFQGASSEAAHSSSLFNDLFASSDIHHSQTSHCALINVFAQALHTSGAQSLTSNSNANGNNNHYNNHNNGSLIFGPGQHLTSVAPSSLISQSQSSSASTCGINVKYYFANIDNKSSVISLSKLLIREKAVQDGEPRIYLISSNPSQPEMYELAFLSKRHQVNFVEKLKSCIEQHHKNSLDHDSVDEDEFDIIHGTHLSLYGGNNDCEGEEEEMEEEEDDEEEEEEEGEDNEDDDEIEDDVGVSNLDSCEYQSVGEEAGDTSRSDFADDCCRPDATSNGHGCSASNRAQQARRQRLYRHRHRRRRLQPATVDDELLVDSIQCSRRQNGCKVTARAATNDLLQKRQSCKVVTGNTSMDGELYFENLDIEEDVVSPSENQLAEEEEEKRQKQQQHEQQSKGEESDEPASFLYLPPNGIPREVVQSPNGFVDHQQQQQVQTEQKTHPLVNNEEETREDGGDNESADEPESNESGLSERAKDSLDESSAINALSKQKLRGPRRRRIQRPRQISNQSSSSSEAATSHRQAIKLVISRQQDSTSSAATSMNDGFLVTLSSDNKSFDNDEKTLVGGNDEEEFDSGRGHDDSSSAASTSSNSLNSRTGGSRDKSATIVQNLEDKHNGQESVEKFYMSKEKQTQQQSQSQNTIDGKREKRIDLKLLKSSISLSTSSITSTLMSSITGSSSGSNDNSVAVSMTPTTMVNQADLQREKDKSMTTATTITTPNTTSATNNSSSCASSTTSGITAESSLANCQQLKSNLVKCSSILSKSSCSFIKQRKLSTVSTMSSQLKLINKLKNNCYGQHHNPNQYACLNCCCQNHAIRISQDGSSVSNVNFQITNTSSAPAAGNCCSPGCLSQQSTLSKQMRQQLRRSSFIPEQKLEELRDLRIQLDKDKQEWQEKFDKMQEQLLDERRELDLAREKLKQDRQQVANEREQLYRKLDVLKEKGILLSPSHKVIITTPELRIFPPNNDIQQQQQQQNIIRGNNQRQPLQGLNNTSNSPPSSIRIPFHSNKSMSQIQNHPPYSVNMSPNAEVSNAMRGQNQSTNLFIQSSATACKVPLHLSEGATSKSSLLSTPNNRTSSLIGGLLGAAQMNINKHNPNIESHLI